MQPSKIKYSFNDHLLSFVWLMLLIMPNNNVFYYTVPISFMLLFRAYDNLELNVRDLIISIVLLLFSSLIINSWESYVGDKDIFRTITLIILFISFAKQKGERIIKYYIIFAAIYLIVTQFAFAFNISFVKNIITTYYPYDDERNIYGYMERFSLDTFSGSRLGGIFYNPNQYARYIEFVLLAILCEIKQFKKPELLILIPMIVLSVTATGSRTAFIVMLFIFILFLFFNKKITISNLIFLSIAGVLIYIFLPSTTSVLRIFTINEGLDSSLSMKFSLLNDYLDSNRSFLATLFGNISASVMTEKYHLFVAGTDFDIGNIIVMYGYLFFLIFALFCIIIYRRMLPKYRIVFLILFWMLSSSIICNYRTAPMFLLMLGLYYRRSLMEKNYEE